MPVFTTTQMPLDANNVAMPVLRLRPGASHAFAVTATSARNATAFNAETRVVSVYATTAIFIRFGTSTVAAATSDHYIPADTLIDIAIAAADDAPFTHVAAVRASADGTLYVSEKY